MISYMMKECDFSTIASDKGGDKGTKEGRDHRSLAQRITAAELACEYAADFTLDVKVNLQTQAPKCPIVGITGTGGAGKSSLTDEIVQRFLRQYSDKTIAILSVDPTKQRSGELCLEIEYA